MKRYILIFVILFLPALSFGQTYNPHYISTQYYDWGGIDLIRGLCNNSQEPNHVISGITDAGAVIMKTDSQGNRLWTWTGATNSIIGEISALPNSSYVFLYTTLQNGTNGKIANMSQDGLLLWEKQISIAKSNLICVDTNNSLVASLDYAHMVKILDYNGNPVDSLLLNDNAQLYGRLYYSNNTIIVGGLGSGGINFNHNSFLAKYQKNNGIWEKMWQNTIADGFRTEFTIDVNGYIFLGTSLFYTDHSSFITQKIDQDGNVIWSQEWTPPNQTLGNDVRDIILLPDNKGILTVGGIVLNNYGLTTGGVLAYDLEGNFLFQKNNPENNTRYERAKFDAQNRLIIVGEIFENQTSDIFLQFWSIDGITTVEPVTAPLPTNFSLSQNYPNPFNPTTTIQFSLPQAENITLKVFDLLGQEVETLVDEYLPAGTYETTFSGINLSSGIYIYEIKAGKFFIEKKKMVLLK